jgi:16S rRNA (adenine1518-N6/adenine1519-N6)-dimethyltransferase
MIRAKKSLGQHFLTSEAAIAHIIEAADITPHETVLEVGPGRGVLTRALLDAGAHVIAVEKDRELIAPLGAQFSEEVRKGQIEIIEGDALTFKAPAGAYKIVANLPYYITGQFIRKFLEGESGTEHVTQPSRMVLLLQKEVVDRIIAADKKESLLSLGVKAYGTPRRVAVVKRGSFVPAPAVDSAILLIENISKKNFNTISEKDFFHILHAGFAHKRKKLAGNLGAIASKEMIAATFEMAGISPNVRAEDVSLEDWKKLVEKLQ